MSRKQSLESTKVVPAERPQDRLADPGDFEAGRPVPLFIPSAVLREWDINEVSAEARDEIVAERAPAIGYEFPWGQITEERYADPPSADIPAPGHPVISWHFALTDLHHHVLNVGRNLGELSDISVDVFDDCLENCLVDLGSKGDAEGASRSPCDFAAFEEGDAISAFEICVYDPARVALVRDWIATVFIPVALPLFTRHVVDADLMIAAQH